VVLARNVAVSFVRGRFTEARHRHRLVELTEPDRPEERALRQEEAARAAAEVGSTGAGQAPGGLRAWVRNHPGQAAAGTGAVVGAALLAAQLWVATLRRSRRWRHPPPSSRETSR
jgi:hypothetical protein